MTALASSSLPLSMRMLPHLAMAMARSAGPSVWGRHQPPVYGSWTRGIGTRHTWHGRVTWSSMVNFGSILTRVVKEMFTIFLNSLLKVVINFADKSPNFMQTHHV